MDAIDLEGLGTADAGDVSLAYVEAGAGEPVVLVHGSASDLRSWRHQVPALARRHRTIAYSRRYARPNPDIDDDDADDPMLTHVEDLVAFLDAVGACPAHLVGHSWGGFIALLTAIRHPEAVKSLVLLEPPVLSLFVSTPPRPAELLRTLRTHPRTALAILRFGGGAVAPAQRAFRRGDDEAGMRAFAQGVLGKTFFERLQPDELDESRGNLRAVRAQLLGAGFPPLRDAEVRALQVPILLVHGEESPAILLRLTERLAELLPGAARCGIPGASHRMQIDAPEAVNCAILDFLAGVTASDAKGATATCTTS